MVTVTCRRCGEDFTYAYAGTGPPRAFHRPDDKSEKAEDCRRIYNNRKLRPDRALEAAVARLMDGDPEVERIIKKRWATALDYMVRRESAKAIRLNNHTSDLSRTKKWLSRDGLLIDLGRADLREYRKALAEATEAGRGLLAQPYSARKAHATLALYREVMVKRFLPLIDDLTKLLEE
jgi:hypothetical protein